VIATSPAYHNHRLSDFCRISRTLPALQPLGVERHANTVIPQNFDQVTSSASENVQIPACGSRFNTSWTCSARLFMPCRMSVWPTASHTRTPDGDRNHPRDSALTTAAANSGATETGIRTRTLPVNSSSMAGASRQPFSIFAAGLSLAISTGVKPEPASRAIPAASHKSGSTKCQHGALHRKPSRLAQNSRRRSLASAPRSIVAGAPGQ
jgi:hypothetical protein